MKRYARGVFGVEVFGLAGKTGYPMLPRDYPDRETNTAVVD
jgi:hypothetical protein